MQTDNQIYVVIGGTSGIGAELAGLLKAEGAQVHVASRRTGLDISDEQSVYHFFESVGAFDHLIITAGPSLRQAGWLMLNWLRPKLPSIPSFGAQ